MEEKIIDSSEAEVEKAPVKSKEEEYLERFQRLQAEFDNFRKRTEKEKQETIVNANASLISELLEVIDSFELSLKDNKDKGVSLVYEELMKILAKQGLRAVDINGIFI